MNVWTEPLKRGDRVKVGNGGDKFNRIFVTYIEGAIFPYVCVSFGNEENFHNGEQFSIARWKYAQRIIEPEYRPFTGKEMAELPGKDIINLDTGEKETVAVYEKRYFKYSNIVEVVKVYESSISISAGMLLRYWTFPDGSPCGVEKS